MSIEDSRSELPVPIKEFLYFIFDVMSMERVMNEYKVRWIICAFVGNDFLFRWDIVCYILNPVVSYPCIIFYYF